MAKSKIIYKIFNAGPLLLLYYLCLSEVDTNLEKTFEIFTLNFQIILIYFWIIKRPEIMANGHIFVAGLINDVVMGFPLGISSLSYLIIIFVGTYVKNSVNTTFASDCFTFYGNGFQVFYFFLLNNFSDLSFPYSNRLQYVFYFIYVSYFWILFNFIN